MRRRIFHMALVLLLLFALLLPGCGNRAPKDDGPLTINPDGTVGLLRWGMTWEEVQRADSRIVFPEEAGDADADHVSKAANVEFMDRQAGLTLRFIRFPEEGENAPRRLYMIHIFSNLKAGEPDYIPLVKACLTSDTVEVGRQRRGSGEWGSTKTLEDCIPRDRLDALYPEWAELTEEDRATKHHLWRVGALSTRGPYDAGGMPAITGDREFIYNALGYYLILADILTRRG